MTYRFILTQVVFEKNSWRKLSGLTIPIAQRLTVIAGHNGIGKSSILGFIANAAGLEKDDSGSKIKSYFGLPFISQFQEQFRLTRADISTNAKGKGHICLSFNVSNTGKSIEKICNIGETTTNNGEPRFRVVPRTRGAKKEFGVGPSQKIKMPTIFISASRVWPLGESSEVKVSRIPMDREDAEFIKEFHNYLVPGQATSSDINELRVSIGTGSAKRSRFPTYGYEVTAISLGQESVGAIATALASFRYLERTLGEKYMGGILVIDEVEAGLHPWAQDKLIKLLCKTAKDLKLQVIVTTHSLVVLETVARMTGGPEAIDHIVYLRDTQKPEVLSGLSIQEIRDEMTLGKTASAKARRPVVTIYTEDEEALFVLNQMLIALPQGKKLEKVGAVIRKVPLSLGAGQLLRLVSNEKAIHFRKEAVCVFDGDKKTKTPPDGATCLFLPTAGGASNSPEQELAKFLENAKDTESKQAKALEQWHISSDYVQSYLDRLEEIKQREKKNRDTYKKWFREIKKKKKEAIIKAWASTYQDEFKTFVKDFYTCIRKVRRDVLYCPHYQDDH